MLRRYTAANPSAARAPHEMSLCRLKYMPTNRVAVPVADVVQNIRAIDVVSRCADPGGSPSINAIDHAPTRWSRRAAPMHANEMSSTAGTAGEAHVGVAQELRHHMHGELRTPRP